MAQLNNNKPDSKAKNGDSHCCPELAILLDPKLFRALGEGNRLALLMRLAACGRPCTVGELNSCCPVDLSVVSRHLAILREAGALEATKSGKQVHYRVCFERLVPLLRAIADALEACQCSSNRCTVVAIKHPASSDAPSPARSSRQDPSPTQPTQPGKDEPS